MRTSTLRAVQRLDFLFGETRSRARLAVERRAQTRRLIALGELGVQAQRVMASALAQPPVPVVADGDMADLVAQDDAEDLDRACIAGKAELLLQRRRRIEPAR